MIAAFRRAFSVASYGPVTRAEQIARYNRDLQDSVNEIETSINHFDKYGDPKGDKASEEPRKHEQELEWPQKMSLSWLFKHAPIGLWLKFISALVAAVFIFGIAFGQTGLYANLEHLWKTKGTAETQVNKEPNHTVEPDARKSGAPRSTINFNLFPFYFGPTLLEGPPFFCSLEIWDSAPSAVPPPVRACV